MSAGCVAVEVDLVVDVVAAEVDLVVDVEPPQAAISRSATTTVDDVCGYMPPPVSSVAETIAAPLDAA